MPGAPEKPTILDGIAQMHAHRRRRRIAIATAVLLAGGLAAILWLLLR